MLTARLHNVQWQSPQGLHNMAYREWGNPDNPHVLLCVHGLTRTGADFNTLAQRLGQHMRVVAPDMPGRGKSDWLSNPALYAVHFYIAACVTLVARLNPEKLDWLGTSLGGLIGIGYASLPNNPIHKMILNDVGPSLDPKALSRIADYVGNAAFFDTYEQASAMIKQISQPFGPHSEAQWDELCKSVLMKKETAQGLQWTTHYDPAIAQAFQSISHEATKLHEQALWQAYDAIETETLVVRGQHSDLLSVETVHAMQKRGPKARYAEIQGVGHAPTFMQNDQIDLVERFLF